MEGTTRGTNPRTDQDRCHTTRNPSSRNHRCPTTRCTITPVTPRDRAIHLRGRYLPSYRREPCHRWTRAHGRIRCRFYLIPNAVSYVNQILTLSSQGGPRRSKSPPQISYGQNPMMEKVVTGRTPSRSLSANATQQQMGGNPGFQHQPNGRLRKGTSAHAVMNPLQRDEDDPPMAMWQQQRRK